MGRKSLIVYGSHTGHTEKVAGRFAKVFERRGWACDLFKVRRNAEDILRPPFDPKEYDLLCVGSGAISHLPYIEVLSVIRRWLYGVDPRIPLRMGGVDISFLKDEPLLDAPEPDLTEHHRKIEFGPDSKKAIVFMTYAGYEFGPAEAEPGLGLLALEVGHLRFECIGKFSCPGPFLNDPTPRTYHGDLRGRPNEEDLLSAERFLEERLSQLSGASVRFG